MGLQAEERHRLDQLDPLVHQGGAVDRDLRPHGPYGMAERHLGRDRLQLRRRPGPKRAARGREEDTPHGGGLAVQALPHRVVLAVQRTQLIPRPYQGHHPRPRDDDALLVRQGDLLPRAQGGLQGRDGRGPGGREDHVVHRRVLRHGNQAPGAPELFCPRFLRTQTGRRVVDAEHCNTELRRQRHQFFGGRPRGEGTDLERVGVGAAHVQDGRPHAARRPDDRNPLPSRPHHVRTIPKSR